MPLRRAGLVVRRAHHDCGPRIGHRRAFCVPRLTPDDSFLQGDEPLRFMVNRSALPDESSRARAKATGDGFRGVRKRHIPADGMDGTTTIKAAAAAALALMALGGAIGPALAEEDAALAVPAVSPTIDVPDDLPRFVPSAEPEIGIVSGLAPAGDLSVTGSPDAADEVLEDIPDGVASWYGARFAGRKTASGERFDPDQYTAAHRTLPFGSRVRVTHDGRSVVVRINDRGPFHDGRVIDLSRAAAEDLGIRHAGQGRVELALLER